MNIALFAKRNALYAVSFSFKVLIPAYILSYARLHSAIFFEAAEIYLVSSKEAVFSKSTTQLLYKSTKLYIEEILVSLSIEFKSDKYFIDSSLLVITLFFGREKFMAGISSIGKKSFQTLPLPCSSISQSTEVPSPVPYIFLWR